MSRNRPGVSRALPVDVPPTMLAHRSPQAPGRTSTVKA